MTHKKIPLIRRPWFAFFSSMRFAVSLLSLLAIASVIGTILKQNQSLQDYVVKFGPFWTEIFAFLGLFDVYASSWFVVIMLFLVLSTSLCLWRNVPPFLREMKSFRLKATAKSLQHMRHNDEISGSLSPEIAERYLQVQGFKTKRVERSDGSILVAAKKGAMNKWGYIFAHAAIIVICLGGLIDSNLILKIGMLAGKIIPDNNSVYVKDFKPESRLGSHNLSFRGNVEITEGQTADVAFVNADKGILLQELPFDIELKKFYVDFYDTGMPRDFASDIVVTDKKTGTKKAETIRVNHPLTIDGITIYQANYGDGGSKIRFKTWDLKGVNQPVELRAVSKRDYPLDLGNNGKFKLEFGELRPYNVENLNEQHESQQFTKKIHDARSVKQERQFQNIGPTITYRIRDNAGQAHEYMNYMLPLKRNGEYFFATGERASLEEQYRWLMIPADAQTKMDSFMALRQALLLPEMREKVVSLAVANVEEKVRPQFKLAVENLLHQFAEGGYVAINEHIEKTVPQAEREQTGELMYKILFGAMNIMLDEALKQNKLPEMAMGETRNRFLLNSMDAYTGLTRLKAPLLMQLDSFQQVNMSGLQIVKSPGAGIVYIGSLLLVLGVVFMFYVREKRAWVLFEKGVIRFAMSSSRNERDLNKEFPEHQQNLTKLAKDLAQTT